MTYLAMALVSCAVLLFEVGIVRILSVVVWYHFAFLSLTLAMLGIGAPGVWFALRAPRPGALRRSLLAAAVAAPVAIALVFRAGAHVSQVSDVGFPEPTQLRARVALAVACTLAVMLCLGSAVCLLLLRARGRSFGRMYAADLAGAATGALLVVPLMTVIPTPLLVAGSGLLPLAAAVIVCRPFPRAAVLVGVAVVAGLIWGEPFRLRYTKLTQKESDTLYENWTPTARITVSPGPDLAFGWGFGSRFERQPIEQYWLAQDGSAGTPITRVDGPVENLPHVLHDVTSVAYQIRPLGRICIIGSGGGRDILDAVAAGARSVDAVEINAGIVEALSGPFREFSGDVYRLPGVRAQVAEGRSFLTRAKRRYDLIQISLIDSWAATSVGAYALSENHLYTVEAMRLYLRRLSPEGLLSVSRWAKGPPFLEAPRLVLLAKKALELEGVERPLEHLVTVQGDFIATVLVSSRPFPDAEIARLGEVCESQGFLQHWPVHATTPESSAVAFVLANGSGALEDLGVDISPPTDDRPFFFQTLPVFGRMKPGATWSFSVNEASVALLRWLLAGVTLLAIGAFFLPFALAGRLERHPGFWRGSAYFAAIGLAFMLVEAPWLQRFILYLGHPSHATTVVLSIILVGAGTGSLAASWVPLRVIHAGRFLLPPVVLGVNVLLAPLFAWSLGWGFPFRVAISLAVLLVPAFLMGFAFPAGMLRFGDENKAWFWAMNGMSGVLASVASLAMAMAVGFSAVAAVGAAVYLVACFLLPAKSITRAVSASAGPGSSPQGRPRRAPCRE